MQFKVNAKALLEAAKAAGKVAPSKGVHPVYESLEFAAEGATLRVRATDLETYLETVVDLPSPAAVDGVAVVNARALLKVVKALGTADLACAWNTERREFTVEVPAEGEHYTLSGQDPEDFPEFPEVAGASATLSVPDWAGIQRTIPWAAAKERMRFALNGALFELNGSVRAVATDGRRLSLWEAEGSATATADGIVPIRALTVAGAILAGAVTVTLGTNGAGRFVEFRAGGTRVVSRLVEGIFPPYRDILGGDVDTVVRWDRKLLGAAVARVALATTRDAQSIRMRCESGRVILSARSCEARAEKVCNGATAEGPDIVYGFNPAFLSEALGALEGDEAVIGLREKSPMRLREGRFTHVLMPVSIE